MVRGVDDGGRPVELAVEACWRCGVLVVTSLLDMVEHADRAHPPAPLPPEHELGPLPLVESLPQLGRDYPGPVPDHP